MTENTLGLLHKVFHKDEHFMDEIFKSKESISHSGGKEGIKKGSEEFVFLCLLGLRSRFNKDSHLSTCLTVIRALIPR